MKRTHVLSQLNEYINTPIDMNFDAAQEEKERSYVFNNIDVHQERQKEYDGLLHIFERDLEKVQQSIKAYQDQKFSALYKSLIQKEQEYKNQIKKIKFDGGFLHSKLDENLEIEKMENLDMQKKVKKPKKKSATELKINDVTINYYVSSILNHVKQNRLHNAERQYEQSRGALNIEERVIFETRLKTESQNELINIDFLKKPKNNFSMSMR